MRLKASLEIFNYWDSIRGVDAAPLRAQVDPAAIRHILPHIFILETTCDGEPRFRLAGTLVCSLFGRELRDEPFSHLWSTGHPDTVVDTVSQVMRNAAPILIDAMAYTRSERNTGFEVTLLPMRSSPTRCDRLLGCIVPNSGSARISGDLLTPLTINRIYALGGRPKLDTAESVACDTSTWSLAKSVLGLEATVRRALDLMAGRNESAR